MRCRHAIKFGSNTDTLMRDILFDNVTIVDSNGGMASIRTNVIQQSQSKRELRSLLNVPIFFKPLDLFQKLRTFGW